MNDFSGILPSDFSLRSQGKSMAARFASAHTSSSNLNFDAPTSMPASSSWSSTPIGGSLDPSPFFGNNPKSSNSNIAFDDILGGGGNPVKRTGKSSDFSFDWSGGGEKSSHVPVYGKPVYDEDIFDRVQGMKSSSSVNYEDVFSSRSSPPNEGDAFDDLLGSLGKKGPQSTSKAKQGSEKGKKGVLDFEDLLPGFAGSSPRNRPTTDFGPHPKTTVSATKPSSNAMEDPFVVLESPSAPEFPSAAKSADPLEQMNNLSNSENVRVHNSSRSSRAFDDLNPLDGLGKTMPEMRTQSNARESGTRESVSQNSVDGEPSQKPSAGVLDNLPQQQAVPVDGKLDSQEAFLGMHTFSSDPYKSVGPTSPAAETNFQNDMTSHFEQTSESSDDVWLTVSEIPLFTETTLAPPPSRPPPPKPVQISKGEAVPRDSRSSRKEASEVSFLSNSAQYVQSSISAPSTTRGSSMSEIDELEDFSMGRNQNIIDEGRDAVSVEEVEASSAAAAMKDAMDRAEAKFRHAKELKGRENVKASRSREASYFERDKKSVHDAQEKSIREKQEWLEHERLQREKEEEREQKRLEMERAREREREMTRQAVERATREARERAAAEARLKAERAAVGKANFEARARAERLAVQRAQAEARERAAAEAKERAEKAATEARERSNAEAKEKEAQERAAVARVEAESRHRAERAAVERAAAEARERAAAEAWERAASSARTSQLKKENDIESFFNTGARPSSVPRPRSNSSVSPFDSQFQNRHGSDGAKRTSPSVSTNIRKASSAANIVDDLTSIFGAAPSSGDFKDVEGETEDRRRTRLERHQRTQERAAKALAEKNERDLQVQRDQAERHRIAETIDAEIKRWSVGKEGNLRTLLSTLQFVLWPECGWQPVSLTDLITGASVKKVYRKATLCIHPDKVQQKGATLQQKYIAEKVFDLLKEAWNKFNSEELF